MLNKFKATRRAGVPIVGIETADPAATILTIRSAYAEKVPLMQWDIVRGLSPLNETGNAAVTKICDGDNPALVTGNPSEMLSKIATTEDKSIIFMHQAGKLLESNDPGIGLPVSQAIWNLRDVFKTKGCSLVLLGASLTMPVLLKNDVMIIEEPLPSIDELKKIVADTVKSADDQWALKENELTRYAKSLLGLSAFSAEQSLATSIVIDDNEQRTLLKIDEAGLWERKCKTAEQTRGLSIYRGKETYKDIVGYDNAKNFLGKMMSGPDAPEVYVFIDEIEKQMAGFQSDTSGVSGEQMGGMLTWMQDREMLGVLLLGPGGTGKSLLGKATGNEAGKPTVIFDLSGMKASLVGQSTENLKAAQRTVDGIAGGGRILVIATCNRFGSLPPELKRRFSIGTFFFDLPTDQERAGMWKYYMKKFKLMNDMLPECDGWTGAEIRNCCNIAWRLNTNLEEAAKYVVPVSKSGAQELESLRASADGRFISGSNPGFYRRTNTTAPTQRKIKIGRDE